MIRITKKGDYAVFIMGCLAQRTMAAPRGDEDSKPSPGAASIGTAAADPETSAQVNRPGQACAAEQDTGKQDTGKHDTGNTQAGLPAVCSAQEIAETTRLSKSLVANLLKDLTRADLLESVRGLRGGYRLARPAASISLAAILQAVEGPFQLVDCASAHSPQADPETNAGPGQDRGRITGLHSGPNPGQASGQPPPQQQGTAVLDTQSHDCTYTMFCPTRSPMRTLHARIAQMLEDVKLPELVGTPLSHRPTNLAKAGPQFTKALR